MIMEEDLDIFNKLQEAGSNYIRDYAYKNGKYIYEFMNNHDVGKSTYGQLMDLAAKGKKVNT